MMFDRILLVLDDPGDRETMVAALRPLARARGAHVTVLQAVSFLETVAEMPHELSPTRSGDDEAAEGFVVALVASLNAEGWSADGFTDIGSSALMIAAAAERIGASLIVLALRPSRRTEALLRLTRIPVYAIPRGAPLIDRILVPIDATQQSLDVLPHAAALARAFKAEITFVEVGPARWVSLERDALEGARREGATGTLVAGRGDPAAALVGLCRSIPAGAIALASPEAPWVARLMRVSPVPVMVARRPVESRRAVETPESVAVPPPVLLWKRRVPSNPFQGAGEP